MIWRGGVFSEHDRRKRWDHTVLISLNVPVLLDNISQSDEGSCWLFGWVSGSSHRSVALYLKHHDHIPILLLRLKMQLAKIRSSGNKGNFASIIAQRLVFWLPAHGAARCCSSLQAVYTMGGRPKLETRPKDGNKTHQGAECDL